jgi:formylmethanofuran dehydrogenase subunit E
MARLICHWCNNQTDRESAELVLGKIVCLSCLTELKIALDEDDE